MTLRDLLKDPDAYDWRLVVYAPRQPRTLRPDLEVLVVSDYELAPGELPAEAIERGLEESLVVHQIQEVMSALAAHGVPDPTEEQRWAAFVHYLERDAFLDPAALGW